LAALSIAATTGNRGLELVGDLVELVAHGDSVGLRPGRADRGEDHLGAALGDPGQNVAQEVDSAALPGGGEQDRPDRSLQALVGVADDEAHAAEPSRSKAAQEGRPEGAVLGISDGHPSTSRSPLASVGRPDRRVPDARQTSAIVDIVASPLLASERRPDDRQNGDRQLTWTSRSEPRTRNPEGVA
jgi:hypothetical protein